MTATSWFEQSADAVERAWPGLPRCYVCPLCGRGFLREALDHRLLTREHAPPQGLGGHRVALTCRPCNNRAGHDLDDEMLARESTLDFVYGTMSRPLRACLKQGGKTLNVEAQHVGDSILVSGLPLNNHPKDQCAWVAELDRLVDEKGWEDYKFELTLDRGYQVRAALLGWLRAAYLVAFAALGYRYIFSTPLEPVRQQLANISADILDCFSVTIPNASPNERRILLIEDPTWLRSLTVQVGRHIVFLPGFEGGLDLYHSLARERTRDSRLQTTLSGKLFPWPGRPALALDFL